MAPQDSFIDEDEETCPLCVEEFDLTDRNFRPCPCGYQVCQFCFNNIRTNLNGLCPACRRPYDDKTIEYKVVTPEELAQFKANVQKNAKKKAEQRQKEAQKREVESLNRKHLSGLRVIQKNLVYVVGLSPGIKEDEILNTLRGDKYFGQYGKIIKIVVSKGGKNGEVSANGQPSLGVYVTFAKKEDAARCISAVNGSTNGDRVLRAQLGTTKYCSAYLRGETCTNKSCMFLHEPGENENSYSREDLSNINTVNTQRPFPPSASSSGLSRQSAQMLAPIQQAQPVAAATQPMARETSKEGSESGDGSALPSSASWARGGTQQQRSRRGSHATSGAASSPAVSQAVPNTADVVEELPQSIPDGQASEPIAAVPEASHPTRDPVLMELLKSINSLTISFPGTAATNNEESISYPPLFDDQGGEKRRAMRELQEEARLHLEQESQADVQSIAEPVEEEEPESGSLQLGGEPEDREIGREVPQGFQRRPSTQMPIQRASSGGLFGTGLGQNFPQNLGNLSSINGRTLTPLQQQQLLLLKSSQPQTSFADQFPSGLAGGLGQGSPLFQQQGHNRQSSRYSFANDSSSASTVKPTTNPKFLAQQSSMMPTANHAQQGSQFYGSAMPGPPPGLKSSGTPPMGFGHNHSFGGSMGGGSHFGGVGKESSNDMLREMLRNHGSAGSNQVHDAGKRELMFPSFLSQQYPSASSTPAPASGLLASLYGPQTGAFHDFGQKQKKKGKKHRHANTSSSGGGGLVDLADPSILQARMQHQQQSNAGVGHGLFSGQAQDDLDLLPIEKASSDVDALVADNTADDASYRSFAAFDLMSRSSTPSIPPGFGLPLPTVHPTQIQNEPFAVPKIASKIVPTSAPFTPSRNIIPRAATPLTNVSVPSTPTQSIAKPSVPEASRYQKQAKEDVKTLATNSGLSRTIASQSSTPPILQPEDFPALDSGKTKQAAPQTTAKTVTPGKIAPVVAANKRPNTGSSSMLSAPNVSKVDEKSKTAGLLNVSVPSKPAPKPAGLPDAQANPVAGPSAFPPLPTSTPATVQSPLARSAPKTLRLVPTPKTEVPPNGIATPSSTTSMFPQTFVPSRQTSIPSNTRLDRPATPTSEVISDNASITSASISRASSPPPPTKIGSAPVRSTTKSMQKKQRREYQKEKEKEKEKEKLELDVPPKPEPETEIGPIMGRKKKQKKERTVHSAAGGSTPAVSRPATPAPAELASEEPSTSQKTAELSDQAPHPPAHMEREILKPISRLPDSHKAKAKAVRPPTPEPVSNVMEEEEEEQEPAEKPLPTPSAILQELISEGSLEDIPNLNFLKPPSVNVRTLDTPTDMQIANPKLAITPEDRAELLAGKPVHKVLEGGSRIMLTPNGDCVRNLTPDEEKRYLELQDRISKQLGPAAFFSAKHHANSGFTLIGGRAVPNGPPPFFPVLGAGATAMDPVSKIQRDEALSYINQFVLPSLSTNSQLEKALNANALDAEMLRSSDVPTWATWGSDPAGAHPEDGEGAYGTHHEGILAAGLEHMTAHFAIGKDMDRGQPMGNVSLLSLTESESAMQMARKETENLEKRLNTILKKNRRLLLGSGH